MYNEKKFLAVIPARGGSKGIPNKNIIKVNGKPLIQYTIEAALNSKYLDRIIVSTDSLEIAKIVRNCGAEVPFIRPAELATDSSKTIEALLHVVKELSNLNRKAYDYLVLLQPTQPLRQSFHIDEAIVKITNSNLPSLVSVSEVKEHPILMRTINKEGTLTKLLNNNSTIRRQDFPVFYKVNGAIYINILDDTFNEETSLNDNVLPYLMEPKYSLDIDTMDDLDYLEFILKRVPFLDVTY